MSTTNTGAAQQKQYQPVVTALKAGRIAKTSLHPRTANNARKP